MSHVRWVRRDAAGHCGPGYMSNTRYAAPLPPSHRQGVPKRGWELPGVTNTYRELERSGVVTAVLPVGAIEQHGPHLPLSVD